MVACGCDPRLDPCTGYDSIKLHVVLLNRERDGKPSLTAAINGSFVTVYILLLKYVPLKVEVSIYFTGHLD
jgi:hypothetical protein